MSELSSTSDPKDENIVVYFPNSNNEEDDDNIKPSIDDYGEHLTFANIV